jgi:hypothetical protein
METFKKKIAIVLLMVFAISCSNDSASESELEPQTRKNLLLKTTDDDGLISTYTYDSSNKVANYKLNGNMYNPSRDFNFVYNEDGTLHKVTQASDGTSVSEFFYDSNKKLIKKTGNNGIDLYEYVYNSNVLTVNYRYTITNSGWREVYTYDVNGNILEIKTYSNATDADPNGTYSGVIDYTYDDKKSASSSLPQEFLFPNSVNNIKTTQYDGGTIGTSQYEYNTDGYPTKRTDGFIRMYEYKQL